MQERIVVYTAVFGGYDTLQEPTCTDVRCDFVCFTDDATTTSRRWRVVCVPASMDSAMMNRYIKVHPHRYLAEYAASVYIDANLIVRRDPAELVDKYLTDDAFAALRHPTRNCVYDEIQACIMSGKADANAGRAQADRYRSSGYPPQNGLSENRVLLRRHNQPEIIALMDAWWAELSAGVKRDQVGLPFVCWQLGFTMHYMTEDAVFGKYFRYWPHRNERLSVRIKIHTLVLLKRLAALTRRLGGAQEL